MCIYKVQIIKIIADEFLLEKGSAEHKNIGR